MADVTAYANASTTPGTNASINSISILGTGLLSTADDSFRNSIALAAKFYSDITAQDTVGGTGDTITVTTPTLYTAYAPIRLLFTASAANTTATTLNLDGLGAKAVRKISGGTDVALIAGDIPAGARVDVVYSAAANSAAGGWIILGSAQTAFATRAQAATASSTVVSLNPDSLAQERGYSNASFSNFAIGTPSVAASALTIPFNGVDGNAFGAANIAYITFRSATAGSGAVAQLALTALASLVISSGSTLGMTSGVAATLALAIFNDAGTARPAIINPLVLPLVDGIDSATSEGGAGAADSAGVWYSNAAITSKAYTIVGYITVTEATAGTWATAPSTTQVGPAPAVANVFSRISLGVAVASTSGASIDFTGIGAAIAGGARRITFNYTGLSTTGASIPMIQIGDSGGIETSGYLGTGSQLSNAGNNSANFTTGFGLTDAWANTIIAHGSLVLILQASPTTWVATGVGARSDGGAAANTITGGRKSLSPGPIDRIRLTTVGGTDTFNAGSINITIE